MALGRLLDGPSEPVRIDSPRLVSSQWSDGGPFREPSFGDYWRVLQKRKWTVAVSVVVVLVVGAIVTLRATPIYDAVTRILVAPQASNPLNLKDTNAQQATDDQQRDIDTKVRILQSDTMADIVIHRLNLDARVEFAGESQIQKNGGISVLGTTTQEGARQEQLIRKLQANLTVQEIGDTSLVEIRYSDRNPALAADIANAISTAFIEENVKSRYESTTQAAEWLSKQLADLQVKMESSQTKLVEYGKQRNIVGTDDKQNLTTEKLEELNRELTAAQADRIQKESLYKVATSSGNAEALGSVLQDPVLTALRQRKTDLRAQYAVLDTNFGPGYPKVVELTNQLDEADRSYRDQVQNGINRIKNDYQTSVNRESLLQAALAEQTKIADQLNENAIEYKVLKQEADSNRQIYDGLLQQLKEASLAAGLDSSNIRIVDGARVPLHPAKPNIMRNLEFSFLIGLFAGIAIALGLETLDKTVRTPEQAESISGLPTLAMIPFESAVVGIGAGIAKAYSFGKGNIESSPLISYFEPQSEVAEAYRVLRTSILLSSACHPPRSILVTSSLSRDGKTMTCLNIAIALAQMGKRVLLLEADMRCPSMRKVLNLKGDVGLSNILAGDAKEHEAIQASVQHNLFVITAGPVPPHPAELLSSPLIQELLRKWGEEYDHIIVDSPPVISVTDPVLLSVTTDAVLLVVRFRQTTAAHLRRTCNTLQSVKANVLGIVLNAVDLSSPEYSYYYGKYDDRHTEGKAISSSPMPQEQTNARNAGDPS